MSYHDRLFKLATLRKIADNVDKDTARVLKKQLDKGEPHISNNKGVELKEPSTGSEVEFNFTPRKKLSAEVLKKIKARRGESESHRVVGKDSDQYSRREVGVGPGQSRKEHEHIKTSPTSFSSQKSFSFEKVSAVQSQNKRRLRNMKADKSTISRYREVIASDPLIVGQNINKIPMVSFPPNTSAEVEQELQKIEETMETEPLLDSTMEAVDEDPMELFTRACNALGVPVDEDIAPLLVQDLKRIALTLKYVHLRPRPVEVAPYHGYFIKPEYNDSYSDTPSYPSLHAMIGYGLSNFYANLYPEFADQFYGVADQIAVQRIQAGQHFPSDTSYAKLVADTLLQEEPPQKQKQKKEAEWRPRIIIKR